VKVIDTFPAFLAYWDAFRSEPVDVQVEAWATDYMARWPELLEKQVANYASEDADWRQVARERVFPFLNERLPAMRMAHENLLGGCGNVFAEAQRALGFELDVVFVIYVGVGCGAGWGTRFQDSPAVLFGLENIAECGWSRPPSITGLVAHEIGHLVHYDWRARHDLAIESGPWWQLYEEGFAQRCEHVFLGQDSWHMVSDVYGQDWLAWCQEQKEWLAAEFLRRVAQGESVRPFFGSWYDIRGRKQCGYFLGHELIRRLECSMSLEEIALLENVGDWVRRELETWVHRP
jgi:hypothetical protein